jgi:catechol 2,3-dioxygenase-like lactoylglutathione lyase family enzyme
LTPHPHLAQIAFSVTDLKGTHAFYRDALGFLPAGGTESFRGPVASLVQGLPDAASICWWMVDQRDFMQLEMFEFESPPVRPLPGDWRPCDIGYASIGLHVRDFDAVLARLDAAGARPLAPALGGAGARRVCVRDPEGVLLELMEDDSRPAGAPRRLRPEVGVVARSVTVSVPDLARARRFWVDALGLTEARGPALHGPEHEALWGLAGARRETLLLSSRAAGRAPRAIASATRGSSTSRSAFGTRPSSSRSTAASSTPATAPTATPSTWATEASST